MRHCFPTARTWPLARFALRARVDATSVRALSLAPPASASEAQPAAAAAANSAATIAAADARSDGHGVDVRFGDGRASAFDAVWLRENCPSHQHSSGQRLFSVTDLLPGGGGGGGGGDAGGGDAMPASLRVHGAAVADDGAAVEVTWRGGEPAASRFDAAWLRAHDYSPAAFAAQARALSPLRDGGEDGRPPTLGGAPVPRVRFADVMGRPGGDDAGLWAWARALNDRGVCLVTDTPAPEPPASGPADAGAPTPVARLGARLAGPQAGDVARAEGVSHRMYGRTFHVKNDGAAAINIAFTGEALKPHQDLAYYESPPGVQLLHCVAFGRRVVGGESVFVDAHAGAELLRAEDPAAFATLARVPATFQKDAPGRRDAPVQMFYQRPHIACGYDAAGGDGARGLGPVTAVFWAPPFEGPLRVRQEDVAPYFSAYAAFARLLARPDFLAAHGAVFKLRPGDTVTFNNRRILHGRHAFHSDNGSDSDDKDDVRAEDLGRHLEGCYVNIDDLLNTYRVLARRRGEGAAEGGGDAFAGRWPDLAEQRAGNQTHR